MSLIFTIFVLIFPFVTICYFIYLARNGKTPARRSGEIVKIMLVAVISGFPITDIFVKRYILALQSSVLWTYVDKYFYLSNTAVFTYFLLLLLAFIYFCYEMMNRADRRTRS